jgi:hypothetical protein
MHVLLSPGSSKDWGAYILTGWRMSLAEKLTGRIYVDYRNKLGMAEGFGTNYDFDRIGKGDFKFYYTRENDSKLNKNTPHIFERYMARLRHKLDIDELTNLTLEYYKIKDSKRAVLGSNYSFLKDYFFREYEKDELPLSYLSMHRSFSRASLDFIVQGRTNNWYTQLEKLPQLQFTLPNCKIGPTPFYLENLTQAANFNYRYAIDSTSTANDFGDARVDMANKLSLPLKAAFIYLTPFVKDQETYYSTLINGSGRMKTRTIFSSGLDMSTKFYRPFQFGSGAAGKPVNRLRHVITPSIAYVYVHKPTIPASNLYQIDSIDALAASNSMQFQLSNKLQVKRGGTSVDLVDFLLTTNYNFKSKTAGVTTPGKLSDVLFKLKILPVAWIRFEGDATFSRARGTNYNRLSVINYDLDFTLGNGRSFGIGERYLRKGSNELVWDFKWQINPKWGFTFYQRTEFGNSSGIKHGWKEQQFSITRDLHCWQAEFTYNANRALGNQVWLVFRLKAFPELEINYNQSYNKPKSGSQVQ